MADPALGRKGVTAHRKFLRSFGRPANTNDGRSGIGAERPILIPSTSCLQVSGCACGLIYTSVHSPKIALNGSWDHVHDRTRLEELPRKITWPDIMECRQGQT